MYYVRFQQLYCDQHSLSPEKYFKHLRSRALYPHARFLAPIFTLFNADYFAADNDFVHDVARLTHYKEFIGSSLEYMHQPVNRVFLRKYRRIRISTERMRRIVHHTFKDQISSASQDTMTPFSSESGKTKNPAKSPPKNPDQRGSGD